MSSTSPIPVYSIPWQKGEKGGSIRIVTSETVSFPLQKIWMLPHRKDYYMLQYITAGSGRHWVDMVSYEYKPGTLYFTSPEQVHVKEEDVGITGTVITFTKEFFAIGQNRDLSTLPLMQNRCKMHELIIPDAAKPELEQILKNCVHEYQHDEDLHTEMLSSYIRLLLTFLSRLYNSLYTAKEPGCNNDLYRRFQLCLEENYKTKHEASDYGKMLNISPNHLNTLLKKQSGKTVTTHVHERIILEAKRMMFTTDETIKQIAFGLGFQDTSYFSRFFKKFTSFTPSDYQKRIIK